MVDRSKQDVVKAKFAITLNTLIERNKKKREKNNRKGEESIGLDDSLGKISSSTGLRKATLSDIINLKSELKGFTLYLILSSLKSTFTEFGRIYDKVSDDSAHSYIKMIKAGKKK